MTRLADNRVSVQVLEPLMLADDLEQVFGGVAQLFSRNLSDAFRRLQPQVSCLISRAAHRKA